MATPPQALAQRSRTTIHFDHPDLDYYLAWIMGRAVFDGSDAAECLEVAATIPQGDVEQWQRAWRARARMVEATAEQAYHAGDLATARQAYLRACSYYRAPLFVQRPSSADFARDVDRMQACFRQAAALSNPPIEPITVPFAGQELLGYCWKGDASTQPRPTLIVVGGIETFAEDCYFMTGPSGPQRGYTMIAVDLPGQGMTPRQGLHFGARMERSLAAVVDHALRRPDVDPERLAMFGFSWGGHIVFKGGVHDPRIKALVANPPMPNVFRAVLAQQQGHDRRDPIMRLVFDQIVWRMGLRISLHPRDLARRLAKAYDYWIYGRVDTRRIPCPTLCLAGAGEAPITLQIAQECEASLPHPASKLVVFSKESGGEAHCQITALPLLNQTMFDWCGTIFA